MIAAEDAYFTFEYPEIFKILPSINDWGNSPERIKDGKKVAEGFVYSSNNNKDWMQASELQAWIKKNNMKIDGNH